MNTINKFIPLDEVDYMDHTKPLDLVQDLIIRDIIQHEITLNNFLHGASRSRSPHFHKGKTPCNLLSSPRLLDLT